MKFLKRLFEIPPIMYDCWRCDEVKVPGPYMRCLKCEETVDRIMFRAALRGHHLEDPILKYRKEMGR